MMGTFYILLMFLGIIGTSFKDTGMRDVYIQSEIVARGSTDSEVRGKQYNRTIRAHKLFWETFYYLMLERFESKNDKFVFTAAIFFLLNVKLSLTVFE